jgi:hypothetical protein
MKQGMKITAAGASLLVMLAANPTIEAPFDVGVMREARAVVGVPWSPVSMAGVARRTTRRAVVVAESNAAYQQQSAAAQQQAATAQQPAAPSAGAPAIGTVVAKLPAGCAPETIGGVQYQKCGGVYYRAAFQSNNLVYVVTQP